jgi:O-antigen ligase
VYPAWSFYKSLEYFVDLALIAAIITAVQDIKTLKTLLDWTWLLLIVLLLSVWFWVVVWPEEAVVHKIGLLGVQIHGVWPAMETNGVGELGAILGVVGFSRLLFSQSGSSRRFYFMVFAFSFFTIIFAQSRSPLTAFILAIPVVLFMSKRIGALALAFTVATIVFSFTSASEPMWEYFQRGQKDREFESLSGRTLLWNAGWELVREEPIRGYGAYAGARFTGITEQMGTRGSSILNTWMEILLGVGFPGLLLTTTAFLGIWVILCRSTWQSATHVLVHRLGVEILGVLTVILIRSMFSPQVIWHPPVTFLLVVGYTEFVRRSASKQTYENPYSPQLLSAAWR